MAQNIRFARWLAAARAEAKLTQTELAERLNVAQVTIHYWESEGRLAMTPKEVRDLAAALGVTPVAVVTALGYPTQAATVSRPPPPAEPSESDPLWLLDEIVRLQVRLRELLEDEYRERPESTAP